MTAVALKSASPISVSSTRRPEHCADEYQIPPQDLHVTVLS
jgi:hypothetical protein